MHEVDDKLMPLFFKLNYSSTKFKANRKNKMLEKNELV